MKAKIQLLIPMSGQGKRFQAAGYRDPKPLISINGAPMIERLLHSFPNHWETTFVLAENHRGTELPKVLVRLRPKAELLYVEPHTEGPAVPILEALKRMRRNEPVLVSYCDYGMWFDATAFEEFVDKSQCDSCLISYKGFHPHYLNPLAYAYSRLEGDRVVEVKEKGSFTANREAEYASAGAYYFKSAELLQQAVQWQKKHALKHNNEYYTSLTVQALLKENPRANVRVFEIPRFFQWGTPDELEAFCYWENTYHHAETHSLAALPTENVLLPMAGKGSRFISSHGQPKPLISVEGRPMFQQALATLPPAKRTTLVTLSEFDLLVRGKAPGVKTVALPETPAGQALSTEEGLKTLPKNESVWISSCDHGIVLDPSKWRSFLKERFDAAIFTIRGYPGAARTPTAFAYVESQATEQPFLGRVKAISVKQPLSATPSKDDLLVGTFWFKEVSLALKGIELLKKSQKKVNGELYLDSIFSLLMENGVRVARVSLDGYINWGDPRALAEALYWREVFTAVMPARKAGGDR